MVPSRPWEYVGNLVGKFRSWLRYEALGRNVKPPAVTPGLLLLGSGLTLRELARIPGRNDPHPQTGREAHYIGSRWVDSEHLEQKGDPSYHVGVPENIGLSYQRRALWERVEKAV